MSDLAVHLVTACKDRDITLGTAESLTGGMVAADLVDVPGCSAVFRGAVIAYHAEVKVSVLHVPPALAEHVVSEAVACAMAQGLQAVLGVDLALATTGVAGPDPHDDQPPGTTWIAAVLGSGPVQASRYEFSGSRPEVRRAAVDAALRAGLALVQQ